MTFTDKSAEKLHLVSLEEARNFLEINQQYAVLRASGVMLFILAVAMPPLLTGISPVLSLIFSIIFIIAGIILYILSVRKLRPYDYLSKEAIDIAHDVSGMVKEYQTAYNTKHMIETLLGTVLCILSVIPILISDGDFSIALMLIIIASGAGILVKTGKISSGFQKLLEESHYSRSIKADYPKKSITAGYYWITVTQIYLAWSFISGHWESTWMIWPLAGMLFAMIAMLKKHSHK